MCTSYSFIIQFLKEGKAAKVENHSVSAYSIFTQMLGSLFDMLTGAMFRLPSLPSWLGMVNAG